MSLLSTSMSEIIITTIPTAEILQLIESAVVKALDQKPINKTNIQDAILGLKEAVSYLGIAKATVYQKYSKLIVPHFIKGKQMNLGM